MSTAVYCLWLLAAFALIARYGRTVMGARWDFRRPLAALATMSALFIGCAAIAGCQDATAAGPTGPPPSTPAASSSASPTPDPAPLATTPPVVVTSTPAIPAPPTPRKVHAPRTTTVAPAPARPAPENVRSAPEKIRPAPENVRSAPKSSSCDADYYRNSDGKCVHRPQHAAAQPAGATARCTDGTYSFSQNRRGTCSGHGGVAQWL